MVAGSLGSVTFRVGYDQIRTFRDLSRKRAAKHAKHDVLEGRPRLQHTGRDLDALTLTVVLERMSAYDTSPDQGIDDLLEIVETGDEVPLVLGDKYFAKWFLENLTVNHQI